MNKNFEIVNSFKGFGEPKDSIWFIGIEEGGIMDEDIVQKYSMGIYNTEKKGENEGSDVYQIISKIMVQLIYQKDNLDWYKYKDERLFRHNEKVFQTNVYPLGRPDESTWSKKYKALFAFGKNDIAKYREVVTQERFPMLYNFWRENEPKLTICFGKGHWKEFITLLKLDSNLFHDENDSIIKVHPEKKVVLTPFFNNRFMSTNRIQNLIEVVKKYQLLNQ